MRVPNMEAPQSSIFGSQLDEYVSPLEEAHATQQEVNLADFLPPRDHPQYLVILCELVRVDLECRWQKANAHSLEAYLRDFPELRSDTDHLQAIAFEEHRLRRQAGLPSSPADYESRFGVNTRDWPQLPPTIRAANGR